MILVFMVHPLIIRLARKMQILDRPDTRKLQEYPIPVLGGVAVIWGIIVGAGVTSMFFNSNALFPSVVAITVMLYIGLADDILGLSAHVRLLYEIAVIGFVVWMYQTNMNDFHGLFGIHVLPSYLAYPLVFFAGAGIINSINMIDGVDGLSSGLCIMACLVFGIVFAFSHVGTMSVMCFLTAGALIPFFLHNVFGKQSKMFIGDSGTLMMGILMLIFTLHIVDKNSRVVYTFPTMGVVAFTISVMSVPIFDTLRVMIARILKGISPFKADKSHLHHLFIEIGFSHVGTSLCVYILNGLNILLWFVTWQLGFGPTVQFLVVVAVGVANTTGFYYVVRRMNRERIPYKTLKRLAEMSHFEPNPLYGKIRSILDRI
ncbi:MAG: undecaprenyl/decaprenyl-phosphate alpha-N-acetylglucosaminyl 1-phosphate transferase [Prevotella sp.]|nr:undecaprenyl/decaprenyl-phosphate alpha-N-acetylglucosaminyl 1-phosphate transferase [Prevotella sp.]